MELRVHLKVCEGCGCLWYRAQVETGVYCTGCLERLKDFPTAHSRKRPGRPRKLILPTVFAVQTSSQWKAESGPTLTESRRFPSDNPAHQPLNWAPVSALNKRFEAASTQGGAN